MKTAVLLVDNAVYRSSRQDTAAYIRSKPSRPQPGNKQPRQRIFSGLSRTPLPSASSLRDAQQRRLVEYALRDVAKPIGVSTFRVSGELPAPVQGELPTVESLQGVIAKMKDELNRVRKGRGEMSELALVHIPSSEPLPEIRGFDKFRAAVLNGVASANSRRSYSLALDELSALANEQQRPIS